MKQPDINSIDDLVASGSFRKWIIEKDEQEAAFWREWIEQYPARIEWVATAQAIITALGDNTTALSDEEVDVQAALIQQKIGATLPHSNGWKYRRMGAIAIAAAVLGLIAAGYLLFRSDSRQVPPAGPYEAFLHATQNKSVEYNNRSDSAQRIVLSDGSEVLLENNSQLNYAAGFASGKREVYLTGNAFFTIARDPSRPFIVYTRRIVAKVLGTSFRVRAITSEKTTSVLVSTGKVSVFKRENFTSSDAGSGTLKGIVLTPNQEMVYDIDHEEMNKSLAEAPALTNDSVYRFVFDDTPATTVFRKLQEAYGISILLDDEVIASCTITASLGNEPFYEKLNMICKIINASYQVIDGNVVINAKGCR